MATVAVRMNELTKQRLDSLVSKINKLRAKDKKSPLTIAQVLEMAVESLAERDGLL